MDYADARDLIKTGDMILFRDHPDGSLRSVIERRIVKHTTSSPYVHVGMSWAGHGRVWVMDITTSGCTPRLLSECGSFDWACAPKELSESALWFAHSCFGKWIYSKWQAVLGALKRLVIGADSFGQCAEFVLAVWGKDGMAPTTTATPGACADGAMMHWRSALIFVSNEAPAHA